MPNWHTNAIACHKDNLPLFINDKGQVDFEMMSPMPKALQLPEGTVSDIAIQAVRCDSLDELNSKRSHPVKLPMSLFGFEGPDIETFPELQALGRQYLENEKVYGTRSWYGWCCNAWGTKWNASDTEIIYGPADNPETKDIAVVMFQTAWCPPNPEMFIKFFEKTPNPLFYTEDFDEDFQGVDHWCSPAYEGNAPCIFEEEHMTETDTWTNKDGKTVTETYEYDQAITNIQWAELASRLGLAID